MQNDYFNPSANVEDRRQEDPIRNFLSSIGISMDTLADTQRFGNPQGTFEVEPYLAENPTNTPLATSSLARDAGAQDLAAQETLMAAAQAAKFRKMFYGGR